MYENLTEIIRNSNSIVFFGGAGVSTESGIPDFRSEQGLYNAQKVYGRSPEELLHHDFFINHPDIFYKYYWENLIYPDAQPNDAHKALAFLESNEGGSKVKAVVTQNIDSLHQAAGSKNVLELHGSVQKYTCEKCGRKYTLEDVLPQKDGIPICECGGTIRPDVVLYGEMLPEETVQAALQAISEADTLIVGGTSLVVYPAAGMIRYFSGDNLVLINKSSTPYDKSADLVINEPIGAVMNEAVSNL